MLIGNLGSYHSNINVETFRGFVLADDIAPLIVINDQDAEPAWSFTLLHEMAHLILGQTGISGGKGEKKIEKFCNDVASEFLLPEAEFDNFKPHSLEFHKLATELSSYAAARKLSGSHIAYRLYRRNSIKEPMWEKLRDHYRKMWRGKRGQVTKPLQGRETKVNWVLSK